MLGLRLRVRGAVPTLPPGLLSLCLLAPVLSRLFDFARRENISDYPLAHVVRDAAIVHQEEEGEGGEDEPGGRGGEKARAK